jgi:type II secretory pathway pseudopilin PulG
VKNDGGFIMLEALVALAILALAASTLMDTVVTQLSRVQQVSVTRAGEEQALATMMRFASDTSARPGEWSGDGRDGWSWQVTARPHREEGMPVRAGGSQLLEVEVTASRAGTRRDLITLRSLVRSSWSGQQF